MKKSVIVILLLAALGAGAWFWAHRPAQTGSAGNPAARTGAAFDKKQYSLTDPASPWVIANKHYPLRPKTYAPADLVAPAIPLRLSAKADEMLLRKDAAAALKELYDNAKQDGVQLMVASGYRSYDFQVSLYNRYVQQQGRTAADSQSARPGYSEHQTGLAVDLEPVSRACEIEECFGDTPEGKWIAANAWKYGFTLRYLPNKQNSTGYIYEPWHVRYVGKPLAAELHTQGTPTLEDFFGLEAAADYL
jgi:D-alanyl-D-alanine carboxypeptidase